MTGFLTDLSWGKMEELFVAFLSGNFARVPLWESSSLNFSILCLL